MVDRRAESARRPTFRRKPLVPAYAVATLFTAATGVMVLTHGLERPADRVVAVVHAILLLLTPILALVYVVRHASQTKTGEKLAAVLVAWAVVFASVLWIIVIAVTLVVGVLFFATANAR